MKRKTRFENGCYVFDFVNATGQECRAEGKSLYELCLALEKLGYTGEAVCAIDGSGVQRGWVYAGEYAESSDWWLPQSQLALLASLAGKTVAAIDAAVAKDPAMKIKDIVTVEPGKMGGAPCIRGFRITVDQVADLIRHNYGDANILRDFPDLWQTDLDAIREWLDAGSKG